MKKKNPLSIIFAAAVLSGCGTISSGNLVKPSEVPAKRITKTAMAPVSNPTEQLPTISSDPWLECESLITSGISPIKVADIIDEDFRRRVQITFTIQNTEAETSYIAQRCMKGKVYACRIDGTANCAEKLDFTTEPNVPMKRFCANPDMEGIVLSPIITGINSAFEWRCHEGTAQITKQIAEPDADGYDKSIWHEIPKPEF